MTTNIPHPRRTLAVFDDYESAQRAVDHLADNGFPVERVAVVGRDLRYVEQVTGRMTIATAALLGALQGAALGALFSLCFGLVFTFSSPDPALPLLVVYGTLVGGLLGAVFGALAHAAAGGRRDFTSAPAMVADRYELVVDADVADRAAELLQGVARGAGADTAANGGAETGARGVPA
jgi:hypothetical protein